MKTQEQRRVYLIQKLLEEADQLKRFRIPQDEYGQKQLLRALMNIRAPGEIDEEFLSVQDEYLKNENVNKGITTLDQLDPVYEDIYLWQGDITTLAVDAIVNAANSGMTGCYVPCHGCIDNAIHTFAGIELRNECFEYIKKKGSEEETGRAVITKGYNLPAKHVIHTVGPIIRGSVSEADEKLLESCYLSCLELADENNLDSIAFCCISTGEFHFPNERAAQIALQAVKEYKKKTKSKIKVIFNVYKDLDYDIYKRLLSQA